VLRELFGIRDMNTRISEVGAIATSQMQQVNRVIADAWAEVQKDDLSTKAQTPWNAANKDEVQALSDTVHEEAKQHVGMAYRGYCLMKVEEAGRRLAAEVARHFVYPPDSSRTSFVRGAISAWSRNREDWKALDTPALMKFFGPVDIPYRERRLLFILAGVNELYTRAERTMARESLIPPSTSSSRKPGACLSSCARRPRQSLITFPRSSLHSSASRC